MKKIVLSDNQLEQIINLREKGIRWLKIEKETGRPVGEASAAVPSACNAAPLLLTCAPFPFATPLPFPFVTSTAPMKRYPNRGSVSIK